MTDVHPDSGSSYDHLAGSPMDAKDHPDTNIPRLEDTSSFHQGINYSDPANDTNSNIPGSIANLRESMGYAAQQAEYKRGESNLGRGPSKMNAQFLKR